MTAISALPTAPSRSDTPADFVTKADAFVAALSTFVTEANAAIGAVNITQWQSGASYTAGTSVVWSPTDFQAYRRKTTSSAGTTDPGGAGDTTNWQRLEVSLTTLQTQAGYAYTTGGSSTAYTLTPSPALASYALFVEFDVKFHTASGAAPTLSISGLATPPNLVKQNADGSFSNIAANDIPANHVSKVVLLSSSQALVRFMPPATTGKLQPITASVASNALTLTLNPTSLDFRSSTIGSGTVNTRAIASAISVVVSSGSTLGTTNATQARLAVLAIDNAGTVELAVVNLAGGNNLDETTLISTTAEGGAGAADTINVIYSTTARSSVPFRVVGFVDITEATAGTWATAPSTIQGMGGAAISSMVGMGNGQTWQNLIGSRSSGTTYYNTTGKPIQVLVVTSSAASNQITGTVGGITIGAPVYNGTSGTTSLSFIVPPGMSYTVTANTGTLGVWNELR